MFEVSEPFSGNGMLFIVGSDADWEEVYGDLLDGEFPKWLFYVLRDHFGERDW